MRCIYAPPATPAPPPYVYTAPAARLRASPMPGGILGSVASRVEVTLSLTVAGRIVAELSRHLDEWSILRGAVAVSVVLSTLTPSRPGGDQGGAAPRSAEPLSSMTLGSALRTLRRVGVIVVAQLVIQQVGASARRGAVGGAGATAHRYYAYHTGGGGSSVLLDEAIPASAWPEIESFVVTSLAIVLVGLAGAATGASGSPELERIRYSIQYTYADAAADLFTDPRIRWVLGVSGTVFMSQISSLSSQPQAQAQAPGSQSAYRSAAHTWVAGVAMAWVNIAVGFLSPSGSSSTWEVRPCPRHCTR